METDPELLERLRSGDEGAFVLLVERYEQPMLRFARSLVPSRAVAEEAVQDTWMGVVRGLERFEGRSSFKTWLFRILANRARSAGASEYRHLPMESGRAVNAASFDESGAWAAPVEPWGEQADARVDALTWAPALKTALDSLPERQRQVVLLRDVEGLSNAEVCDVLDITAGNQRILLHRGRNRLREALLAVMGED
ncbi:MAG TPA: RNA polymerase sigma factor [Acidimicrobiales bacterium]|nr:RNA polymerase sigma factor [Acidimicrobiales bacterium]